MNRPPNKFFDGKPMTFCESLHYCGCPGCVEEIRQRAEQEPPHRPEFLDYLIATYPATAHLSAPTPTATPADAVEGEGS